LAAAVIGNPHAAANDRDNAESVDQQMQSEPSETACKDLDRAEKELQEIFGQLEEIYLPDNSAWARLQISQDTWERFRTAQLDFLYRDPGSSVGFGSTLPICTCKAALRMTLDRIHQLRRLIEVDPGDPCVVRRQ
jgi:uncharacterized protein YecT (DUF1311 family)